MKPSYYNFFFPYNYEKGKMLAYNSLSNSMALIDESSYNEYLAFIKDGTAICDFDFVNNLRKGNFLIDDDIDEIQIIRHNMYATRFNTNSLGLTIAVTSDCNFRCIYCYEKDVINSNYMTKETENSIIAFVENQASVIEHLSVTWYGGEPLMNVGTIERLSRKFIEICEKNNIQFYSNIITNGYNLTSENLNLMKECKVSSMQITIDGDEETHNKRRPLQNGQPTFSKIIDNLFSLKDEVIPVFLRINTDRTNYMNVEAVLKILYEKELTKIVIPYVARVDSSSDCYDEESCLSMTEYLNIKLEFLNLMRKYGYETSAKSNYPIRKNSFCGCDRINSFVVGADGELYKCWDNIGKTDVSIGNINNLKLNRFNSMYFEYMMFDPIFDEKCRQCKYVPICMGGCPNKRIHNQNLVCEETQSKLDIELRSVAWQIKQRG